MFGVWSLSPLTSLTSLCLQECSAQAGLMASRQGEGPGLPWLVLQHRGCPQGQQEARQGGWRLRSRPDQGLRQHLALDGRPECEGNFVSMLRTSRGVISRRSVPLQKMFKFFVQLVRSCSQQIVCGNSKCSDILCRKHASNSLHFK